MDKVSWGQVHEEDSQMACGVYSSTEPLEYIYTDTNVSLGIAYYYKLEYNGEACGGSVEISAQMATAEPIVGETCYVLTLSSNAGGSDPVADPSNSTGCDLGTYKTGESISLTAMPNSGWQVSAWSGTNDDSSKTHINSVTMPSSNYTVTVTYVETIGDDTEAPTGSFITPSPDGTLMIPRTILSVEASDNLSGVKNVTFYVYHDGSWHLVGMDMDGSDGWEYYWPATEIPDQTIEIKVVIEDFAGNISEDIILSNITLTSTHEFGDVVILLATE